MDKENKDFYKNLKNLLDETSSWPSEYIYKFIYKSNENNIEILKDIFRDSSAHFNIFPMLDPMSQREQCMYVI